MKKSLLTLFTSLVIGGLLMVGSTNAMEYTIYGNTTKIVIPNNISGTSIKRCETCSTETLSKENCTDVNEGFNGLKCSHTYENTGTYTVTYNGNNSHFNNLSLNDANVIKINNFDNIKSINNLYINYNTGITFDSNPFENNKIIRTIELNNNNLTSFDIDVPYNSSTNQLSLTNNNLRTIPAKIRKKRGNSSYSYTIKLSNDIEFPQDSSNSNIIDLSNNLINFVGITGIGNEYSTYDPDSFNGFEDTTSYKFERFGYSHLHNSINYSYAITQNGDPVKDLNGNEIMGTTPDTNITINSPLEPGTYEFAVCITELLEPEGCNYDGANVVNFTVNYNESITIDTPEANQEYNIQDNIIGERGRSGNYPEELLSGYEYIIEKGHIEIARGTISLNEIGSCYFQYENHEDCAELNINNLLGNDLEDGDYTLTVYLNDKNNEHIQTTDYWGSTIDVSSFVNFTIITPAPDNPTIQITKPNNTETEAITHFSWTSTIPDGNTFTNYTWEIKSGSTTVTGGTISDDPEITGFEIDDLDNGEYTFYVELNYSRDGNSQPPVHDQNPYFNNGAKSFTVAKTYPSIKINRPLENETGAITYFSWTPNVTSGFSFNNYEWTISKNGTTIISRQYTNIEQTSYETGGLNNGEYTFNIKMNYTQDSNNQSGYAIDRDYASNGGSKTFTISRPNTLNITSPANNGAVLTESENTFSRNGTTSNTFIKYTYTLTGNDYSTGGSFDRINQNSFTIRNLRDGNYTLKVTMETNNGNETDIRTFRVNTSAGVNLTITSPNKTRYTGNYIKTVPMNFTWNGGGSTLISRYTYKLTNTNTNQIIDEGFVNKNNAGSYSAPAQSLPSGTYKFEVTMLDSDSTPIIPTVSHTFNIIIPSYLEILTPSSGQLNIKNVNFTWSGFAEFEDHYKYEVNRVDNQGNIISTIKTGNNIPLSSRSFSLQNLHNGKYTFTVSLMNSSNNEIISGNSTFWIPDDQDLILDISDGVTSTRNIKTGTGIFSWGGKSEDFNGYYYSISGTNFKNEPFIYTGKTYGEVTGSITLTNLSSGRYRFSVNMLDQNDAIITGDSSPFTVDIPASLKITNPSNGSTITSSSTTLSRIGNGDIFRTGYSTDSRHYEYELLQVTASGNEQKAASPKTNANSFSYSSFQDGASYQLTVKLYSGNTLLARDSSSFSISIPKHSSGGGGGSSSKSHPTNDLSVSVTNDEPITNERVEVVVDINDKYTGKVDFTKMQYYSFDEEKRIDIPVTSKNYVSDYSDDAKLGYVKFDSSDRGEKNLSEFIMFSQPGNYRIHVEDKDGYKEYTEFYVGKGNKTQVTAKAPEEDEYYIARSCKKYKIEFLNNLGVYTSPNLKQDEYFVSKDYFKRYIDSKNKRADGCPTNIGWITTTYRDTSNSSDRYTAPNGKVYFINGKNGSYSSTELDKELNGSKKFGSVTDLKYFIRDRNPFISMAKLGPTTAK